MPLQNKMESAPEPSSVKDKAHNPSAPTRPLGQLLKHSQVSEDEMRQALLRSGYLLEHRIETILRRQNWYVDASHAYRDTDTGKSRELDLYAIRPWNIKTKSKGRRSDRVWIELLIECVNNPQPIAFLTKRDPFTSGVNALPEVKFVCDPALVSIKGKKQDVRYFLDTENYQHYCSGRVASQFCSFVRKKDKSEWMATHEDEHFNTFSTLVKALENSLSGFVYTKGTYLNATFLYPVLVLQGALVDVRHDGARLEFKRENWIRYRRSVSLGKEQTSYVIDVVTERGFSKYLKEIEREALKTVFRMKKASEFLKANIKRHPRPKSPFTSRPI